MKHLIYNKTNRLIIVILWFILTTYFLINWVIEDKSFEAGVAVLGLFASNIFSILIPTENDTFNIKIKTNKLINKKGNESLNLLINKDENEEINSYDVEIEYPYIEYEENTPIQKKLNLIIEKIYFKYDIDIKNKKILSSDLIYFTSCYDITFRCENILSIRIINDIFSGGAHGEQQIITLNINLLNGEEFEFKDIFRSSGYEKVNKILENKLQTHEWKEFLHNEPIILRANQNFYINEKTNLVITFYKYELAPGNCGPIEIEVNLNDFKKFINPNGSFHLIYNKYIDSSTIYKGNENTFYFLINK